MHYVCCDIHGQYDLYMELLKKIDFKDEDRLYVLGDVIDRGPDSIGILQDIMKRDNVELFLGNHELMMLDYLSEDGDKATWFYGNNGGRSTYHQFVKLSMIEQVAILHHLRRSWIQRYVEVDGITYALHHSYFLPEKNGQDVRFCEEEDYSSIFKAVWYSPYRFWEHVEPEEYDDGYVHLIGHVPVQNLKVDRPPFYNETLKERLINLDGGCAMLYFGREGGLYCMSLERDADGNHQEIWLPGTDV